MDPVNRTMPNGATIDHIRPQAKGGGDTLANLRLMCRTCNLRRGSTWYPREERETGVARTSVKYPPRLQERMRPYYEQARQLDDRLEDRLSFAFSSQFGYLTACPTNVGTALRVSLMLHLPALKMTGQLERAVRAARDMRLAVRGGTAQ